MGEDRGDLTAQLRLRFAHACGFASVDAWEATCVHRWGEQIAETSSG